MKIDMKKNKRIGFTLVELLAVIVIIGLLLIIAVPKVINTLNNSKKRTFELTAKSIIKAAEEKYLENEAYGLEEEITCESVSNITSSDFSSCGIEFDSIGNASVTLVGIGRYKGLYICNGTKTDAKVQTEECGLIDDGNDNDNDNDNDDSGDVTLPSDTTFPVITIDQKLGTNSDSPLIIGSSSYTVSGTVTDESEIDSLTVNDTNVTVSENGVWSTTLTLTQSVVTEVNIVAKDSKGNTSTENGFIKYGVESGYSYYNGVLLATLPDTPVDMPYMAITPDDDGEGDYYVYFSSAPVYRWLSPNGEYTGISNISSTDGGQAYSWSVGRLAPGATSWEVYTSVYSMTPGTYDSMYPTDFIWANYDVHNYRNPSELFLLKSAPIPVYE